MGSCVRTRSTMIQVKKKGGSTREAEKEGEEGKKKKN
jgi:hypothetical protein